MDGSTLDPTVLASRLEGRALKVIGLGGIGAPVAQALTQFLAFGHIRASLFLIDGDNFEERNLARVLFQTGGNKALSKARELSDACAGALDIVPIPSHVTPRNIHRMIGERDIVFLCVDNHATRRCVDNRCRRLRNVALFSGGNDGIRNDRSGTFGNVLIYLRENGRNRTSPLSRFHPEIAHPKDKRPDELGCAELAQAAPQLLFTNLAVASAMLGSFYAWAGERLEHEEAFLDITLGRMVPVRRGSANGAA